MNPLDEWAAAEIAATMRPCRQYHDGDPTPEPRRSNGSLLRSLCPACGVSYAPSYLPKHIAARHPRTVDETVDNGVEKAS